MPIVKLIEIETRSFIRQEKVDIFNTNFYQSTMYGLEECLFIKVIIVHEIVYTYHVLHSFVDNVRYKCIFIICMIISFF